MGKGGNVGDVASLSENKAAWLYGVNDHRILPFNLPALVPQDVRVRMKVVGISGSDVHYPKKMTCGDYQVKEPMVIGHECAGIIEEVRSEVSSLVPGDGFALEPGIGCWQCNRCKGLTIFSLICASLLPLLFMNLLLIRLCILQTYVSSSLITSPCSRLCILIRLCILQTYVAICEPLSVGVYGCRPAKVGTETTVLIIGAGPIGLVTLLSARAFGAPRIVVEDVDDHRLSVAKNLGSDGIVKVSSTKEFVSTEVDEIKKVMGKDIDVTLDCAGFEKTVSIAFGGNS